MTGFLGTLWSSIKQVKAPYVFDGEHGIALHAIQGNRASSYSEGEVSWVFSSCRGNLGYIPKLRRGWHFKTPLSSATLGFLSSHEGHLKNLFEAWQHNRDTSQCEAGDPGSLSSWHRDIGIPINFQEESGIITFEALNSACLSRCQWDVSPLVEMRRDLGLSLGSAQGIKTSLHLVR